MVSKSNRFSAKCKDKNDWTKYMEREEEHGYTRNGKNVQRLGRTADLDEGT